MSPESNQELLEFQDSGYGGTSHSDRELHQPVARRPSARNNQWTNPSEGIRVIRQEIGKDALMNINDRDIRCCLVIEDRLEIFTWIDIVPQLTSSRLYSYNAFSTL